MTYEEIADVAGIQLHRCGKEWGGTWGYSRHGGVGYTNGFKTKEAAIKRFIQIECGLGTGAFGELCLKLLKRHKLK